MNEFLVIGLIILLLVIYTLLFWYLVRKDFTKEQWRRINRKWSR